MTGCLRVEEAHGAIEWRAVFLIAGMLALAAAMQKTGAADRIALTVLSPAARLGPVALVAVLLLMTAGLTVGISNHATAALLATLALTAAVSHNLDPKTSLVAVAAGTAVALFTPLSHPGFVLVMGPGGYGFRDFVRVGLPLGVLIYVTALIQLAVL